ncbi:hypothetical protein LV716_18380 [Flagellimonas sp. HMM57]|uniref:hypothetical protein n=1 Tax=unclassified Flagellimonas TaxID=2644544 RepID=UPI0013D6649D|nr:MULTISPECIES: hypothetical protein [unclassified Flagellimonas]UII76206.1 hypothetical protein LV716_18380 [Flagellimonas sp. HMM57]
MKDFFIIMFFCLCLVGCKSYETTNESNKNTIKNDYPDDLVMRWKSQNLDYIKGLRALSEENDKEDLHLKNMMVYIDRASTGFNNQDSRREVILDFLYSKHKMQSEDFMIIENHQGERTSYVIVLKDKKITLKWAYGKWQESENEDIPNYEELVNKIKNFVRSNDCEQKSYSFSLITLFNRGSIITALDDKSCQSINI